MHPFHLCCDTAILVRTCNVRSILSLIQGCCSLNWARRWQWCSARRGAGDAQPVGLACAPELVHPLPLPCNDVIVRPPTSSQEESQHQPRPLLCVAGSGRGQLGAACHLLTCPDPLVMRVTPLTVGVLLLRALLTSNIYAIVIISHHCSPRILKSSLFAPPVTPAHCNVCLAPVFTGRARDR